MAKNNSYYETNLYQMGRIKKIKQIRLHHEGTSTLIWGGLALLLINGLIYYFSYGGNMVPF